jgi:hypothetical protein
MRSVVPSSSRNGGVALRRGLLLAGAAALAPMLVAEAAAQNVVVHASEGENQGDIVLAPGLRRLIVSLDRLAPAGTLNLGQLGSKAPVADSLDTGGGGHTLNLTATGAVTANMINTPVSGFDRVVYEATGRDSVLTLEDGVDAQGVRQIRTDTVYVGGDGTINIVGDINTGGTTQQALVVDEFRTANHTGTGQGRLSLILSGAIVGGDVDFGLIDAHAAERVELRNTIDISSGYALEFGSSDGGYLLVADGARIRATNSTLATEQEAVLVSQRGGLFENYGTLIEDGGAGEPGSEEGKRATGVDIDGGTFHNRRTSDTRFGRVVVNGYGVYMQTRDGSAALINDGLIESRMAAAIFTEGQFTENPLYVTRNNSQGVITGADFAYLADALTRDLIVNAGAMNGDVSLGQSRDAYLGVVGADGNVTGTVNGKIDGGAGQDAYGRSYGANGTYAISDSILTGTPNVVGFERHGVEAFGAATVVDLTGTLAYGLTLYGDGTIVNDADVTIAGTDEAVLMAGTGDLANRVSDLRFVNTGDVQTGGAVAVRADFGLGSFDNRGTITAQGTNCCSTAVRVSTVSDSLFNFRNSGLIEAANGQAVYIELAGEDDHGTARFENGGTIEGNVSVLADYADAIDFSNSGRIRAEGGVLLQATGGTAVAAVNSGTIDVGGEYGGAALEVKAAGGANAAAVRNSGTVRNTRDGRAEQDYTYLSMGTFVGLRPGQDETGAATLQNEAGGRIEASGERSSAILVLHDGGQTTGSFNLSNQGQIIGNGTDAIAPNTVIVSGYHLGIGVTVASAIHTDGTVDVITNSGAGRIVGNVDLTDGNDRFESLGTSRLEGELRLGVGDDTLLLGSGGSVITGVSHGGDGNDTLLIDLTNNNSIHGDNFRGFETLRRNGAGTGVLTASGTFDVATLNLDGMTVRVAADTTLATQGDTVITGSANDETVIVQGTVAGDVIMGGGDDTVDNGGVINGDVLLGEGNDRYIARTGGDVNGTVDGGAGANTFIFQLGGGTVGSVPDGVLNFDSYGVYGPGTLDITLATGQNYQNLELLEGANLIVDSSGGTVGNIVGDDSAQHVTLGENVLTGGVALNGGDDVLDMAFSGVLTGALDGGAGNDTLNLTLTGAATINGMNRFETANIIGGSILTLGGALGLGQRINFDASDNELIITAGAAFEGIVDGGAGQDLLRIQSGAADARTVVASQIVAFEDLVSEGAGTLALTAGEYSLDSVVVDGGNLELGTDTELTSEAGIVFTGTANNRFALGANAVVNGLVDGGEGSDTLALLTVANAVRTVDMTNFRNFEALAASGAGEVRIAESMAFEDGARLEGGRLTIGAEATLTASVTGQGGDDTLAVFGALAGSVDLGAGNDRLILSDLDIISGAANGGAGTDTIEFRLNAPSTFDKAGYDSFESLVLAGGELTFNANTDWAGALAVSSGRLIGLAGTTLTVAGGIAVANGATFGSAGIVNGDITVAGTLSPGASPGTMTVNGDVTMLAGSRLLIELTPANGTDLLDVNGVLDIQQGAAIDITGALASTSVAGSALDIVVADSITGRFSTINKSDTVFGMVVQEGNRIQIRSEFAIPEGDYPSNVEASIAYANQVLRAGYGVQAFTEALDVLTDAQGNANQRAFAQLTPEAYGSAIELGNENALLIADAGRTLKVITPHRDGFYGFGQGIIGGSKIAGAIDTGASSSRFRSDGFLGGVGYGLGPLRFGAFMGKLDTNQRLTGLDARTDTNGFVGGFSADAMLGRLGIHGLFAYTSGEATTVRNLDVSASAASSDYDLKSWVGDVTVDYSFDIAPFTLTPKLGVTYVKTRRDGVVEEGAGAFALAVEGGGKSGWFGDAAVAFSGATEIGGMAFTPYAELGVRQLLSGDDMTVRGAFIGAPGAGVTVSGVQRDKTVGRMSLGFGLDLSKSVRLHAGFTGEFGDTDRSNFIGGMTVRF